MAKERANVLMITIPISPPWDNASKNRAYNIALNIQDHTIHLLTKKGESLPWSTRNIVFEDIYWGKNPIIQKLSLILRLLKKDSHIEIYHFFFQPSPSSSIFFRLFLKLRRKRAVQTILNVLEEGADPGKYVFGDTVLIATDYMKKRLAEAGIRNVRKIPPGVDCERFSPRVPAKALREKFDIQDSTIVLYSGEYTRVRGIDQLIDAVSLVQEQMKSVRFLFACRMFKKKDWSREEEIKREVKEKGLSHCITFVRTFPRMEELIGLSDLVVFPSLEMYDKMDIPMTLMEALAMEKPVVISDIPPLNEILIENVGIGIRAGDHAMLAESIIDLLKDPRKRRAMGKRGRRMILERFNIKKTVLEYDKLYSGILHELQN